MSAVAVTAVTVLGKGGAGILKMLLQRNGNTKRDFQTLWQTPARHLISIHIDSRHAALLLGCSITVEQTLMHGGAKF